MLRLALIQVLAHRLRLALTVLAVALGVAFATGSLVLTDTSTRVFDEQFATATSGADLTVTTAVAFDSGMGVEVERDPLPARLVDTIVGVPGVAAVDGVAAGSGLLTRAGRPITPAGASVLSSWTDTGPYRLRTGRVPFSAGEVAIDAATAQAHNLTLGDNVGVQSRRTRTLRVVGLIGFGEQPGIPNSTIALTGLGQAQDLLDLNHRLSAVQVTAAAGTDPAQLHDRVAEQLGSRYAVTLSRDTAAAGVAAAKDRLAYLKVMLIVLAAAALLIGAYLIANTFSIVVTQRTRELAVLRAAGATGRQVSAMVIGEALVVGVVGSLVGVAGGVLAAVGLRDLVSGFGVVVPEGSITVLPRSVALALLIGVAVTVVAAAGPSRRASRVSPLQALRESAAVTVTGRLRIVAGLVAAVTAAVSMITVLVASAPIVVVGVAAAATVIALSLLGPVLAPRVVRAVAGPLRRLGGVPGRLAGEFAARSPQRTAATVLALGLSLALVAFITVLAASIRTSIAGTYREVVTADLVIESARGEMLGGLAPDVHHHVMDLPEVAVAARTQYGHWKDGDIINALTAVDPDTIDDVTDIQPVAGTLTAVNDGGVVIAEHVATERGLGLNDTLPMTFARSGTNALRIVGIIEDNDARALSTDFLISQTTYERLYTERMDASVFIATADGVSPEAARQAITAALADFPTAELRDQQAAIASRTASIDQILGLVTALLLFTVVMATLGITNTLALSIVERTRELGLLRAVGMTRGQVRAMVRAESSLLAVLAAVVGLAAGIGFAALTVAVFARTGTISLVVPADRILLIGGLALAAGLLSGLLPARRAARLPVLDAVSAR